jgi:hypothetical protein
VLRGLAHAAWLILLTRPASATLFAELGVVRSESAADCPDAGALSERVERIRHAPVRSSKAPASDVVQVKVEFSRTAGEYSARLGFRGPKRGERELRDSSASCEALAEAVSVAIALTLDQAEEPSGAAAATPPAEKSPADAVRSASERRADIVPPSSSESRERLGVGVMVESGAAIAFGSALAWSLGGRVQGAYGGFALELGVHALLPTTTAASPGRLRTTWMFGEAALCRRWGRDVSIGPCASFALGRVRGTGVGYEAVREADLSWLALGAGVGAQGLIAGPLVWGVSGTLWVPLRKLTFSVENGGVVWESSPISALVAAGIGLRFR